jgi:hypothetical protein
MTRAMLQANRTEHIKTQIQNYVNHWVRRLYANVIQASKQSDQTRYVFSDIAETTDPLFFPYSGSLQECCVEAVVSELRKKFPDSDVQYDNRVLTIDWS